MFKTYPISEVQVLEGLNSKIAVDVPLFLAPHRGRVDGHVSLNLVSFFANFSLKRLIKANIYNTWTHSINPNTKREWSSLVMVVVWGL